MGTAHAKSPSRELTRIERNNLSKLEAGKGVVDVWLEPLNPIVPFHIRSGDRNPIVVDYFNRLSSV